LAFSKLEISFGEMCYFLQKFNFSCRGAGFKEGNFRTVIKINEKKTCINQGKITLENFLLF
jgi:hypothetical protein